MSDHVCTASNAELCAGCVILFRTLQTRRTHSTMLPTATTVGTATPRGRQRIKHGNVPRGIPKYPEQINSRDTLMNGIAMHAAAASIFNAPKNWQFLFFFFRTMEMRTCECTWGWQGVSPGFLIRQITKSQNFLIIFFYSKTG